ncbi:MAG: hypothetical protein JWN23_3400 [Rhodocyclales bacterium]|nr:hypothetical protein [Rhodocyclales bacterium]
MQHRRKLFCWLIGIVLALPLMAAIFYFCVAYLLVLFPANRQQTNDDKTIDAFVISNGMHVDFVFPVKSSAIDWTTRFPMKDFIAPPPHPAYIAIGWGDREFYLNTQNLSDITASRAFGALAGEHRTLIHVDYLPNLNFGTRIYRLPLSPMQYASLIRYVQRSLMLSPIGQGIPVPNRHYGSLDAFYEATGSYSLFNTCNTWVGDGLRQAGIEVSRWTPLDSQVVWHLSPLKR